MGAARLRMVNGAFSVYVTRAEYENLNEYLFQPYHKLGGNGTAERIMKEVERLPLRERKDSIC